MTTFQIWYMRPEWFADGTWGTHPDPDNLSATHVHLKDLELPGDPYQLDRVFRNMQAEFWSPNGEARSLIEAKGLRHTSMSVGDVIAVDGMVFMVSSTGFDRLQKREVNNV